MGTDLDYEWLLSHLPNGNHSLKTREELAQRVTNLLTERIEKGQLPYTMGVFGGWGSGKTTFLALLAKKLEITGGCKVVYFNSWKYAGFMEIVPSLIYKILKYGMADSVIEPEKIAMSVLLSLGKEYSDKFGKWAEARIGVNLVDLCKDATNLKKIYDEAGKPVATKIIKEYYTQVDKAQDMLLEILGKVQPGEKVLNPVIVLVDELDRCDPDEAFNVIKQMRVLFAMRNLPVAFVMCANPEPIGLAIKHRYGLESASGDYESRRILEKFVDAYEDFTEPSPLGGLVRNMWSDVSLPELPWIMGIDMANNNTEFNNDTVMNANVFDIISTDIPYFANLRVLQKTFNYIQGHTTWNRNLIWTLWHLEIVDQLDPVFRNNLRTLANSIQRIVELSYCYIEEKIKIKAEGNKFHFLTDKGQTLFAIFRSLFWEFGEGEVNRLFEATDQESRKQLTCLQDILADYKKVDFLVSMSLLPFPGLPSHTQLIKHATGEMPKFGQVFRQGLAKEFGWTIAKM